MVGTLQWIWPPDLFFACNTNKPVIEINYNKVVIHTIVYFYFFSSLDEKNTAKKRLKMHFVLFGFAHSNIMEMPALR